MHEEVDQQSSHYQRTEDRRTNTNCECDAEALNRTSAEPDQNRRRDQSRDVGVHNRRSYLIECTCGGILNTFTALKLFT